VKIEQLKFNERQRYRYLRKSNSEYTKNNVKNNVFKFLNKYFKNKESKDYLAIYWPLKDEIDLRNLSEKFLIALPKCLPNKTLEFYAWKNSPLEKDIQGIPSPNNSVLLNHEQISMIFVPCLSVDKKLTRLGYGGGYFDYLRSDYFWGSIPCIGILTSNCISKSLLPKAKWDVPLTGYITDKEILV
tara:strand:+ start:703 stop:1260 length:558 start_codon:yes stop_codon:yes gene_type:complete